MCACALILLVLPAAAQSRSDADLSAQLRHQLATMKKDRQVVGFFKTHAWLLDDQRFAVEARRQLRLHAASLARSKRRTEATRRALRQRARTRLLAARAAATPKAAICRVFGSYCREALAVSRCESGLRTDAQNGQHRGLFQMGSNERELFGHGATAAQQARAAHRYFVASGRDWSPWSCKPWS